MEQGQVTIKLKGYRCTRCGHEWVPRKSTTGKPKVCPKCKSAWWDEPRRAKSKPTG